MATKNQATATSQQDAAFNKSDMHRLVEATHVNVKRDKEWLFQGPKAIVLDTGSHVWVSGSYSDEDKEIPEIKRVGDGRSNGYDIHGSCVLSVPAEWCTFLDEKQAEEVMACIDADEKLLGYAQ